MADGQVVFEIKGDNKSITKSINDTTQTIKSESKKWESDVDDSTENMTKAFDRALDIKRVKDWGIQLAKELARFGVECIETASDLEEVQNVVDVTFGKEGSAKIEKWAKSAGSQFGLTELQAKRYASTLGAMMKSSGMTTDEIYDMSTGLSELTADMASFYNLPFDEAFSKIQSGMAGMTMPLRQLGIDMTEGQLKAFAMAEGFETAYDQMSETEQMIVRYKYLLKATNDAQGDFVRTSDSYANSQRRIATGVDTLKAELGNILLPIATQVSDAVADLLEMLTYVPPETAFDVAQESMQDAVSSASQAQGILGYMDKLYEKYGDMATNTEEWATALEQLKSVFPDVNKFIDEETGALTATNEQLKEYIENSKQMAIEDAKKTAMSSLTEQYVKAGQDYYTAEINKELAQSQADQARSDLISYIRSKAGNENFTGEGLGIDQIKDVAYRIANEFGESQDVINEWVRIYNEQTTKAKEFGSEMDQLSAKLYSLENDLNIATQALERLASSASTASASLGGSAGMNSGQYYNWFYSGKGFATGLDYVPVEGLYHLHAGERVQTEAEASLNRMANLQRPSFDYDTFGNVMRNNIRTGGDVYLDGRVVGQVISAQQANSYRALQRSGWMG